jgi:hypothetical protein
MNKEDFFLFSEMADDARQIVGHQGKVAMHSAMPLTGLGYMSSRRW